LTLKKDFQLCLFYLGQHCSRLNYNSAINVEFDSFPDFCPNYGIVLNKASIATDILDNVE
jgi:hypothetical protein